MGKGWLDFLKRVSCLLSFTILNILKNKEGIVKIQIYSSVIEINQIKVIFFAII